MTTTLYDQFVTDIDLAIKEQNMTKIQEILKILSKITTLTRPGEKLKRTPEVLALSRLRAQGYLTRLYATRDKLNQTTNMYEGASGYIPSDAEKNDPRFSMALSVDVNPYTMKKSAKKFGWDIKRDGTPPLLRNRDK